METEKGFVINNEAFNYAQEMIQNFTEIFECDYDTMIEVFEIVNDRLNGR